LPVLQPFAALYVLILAVLGPLLTKESERIYNILNRPRKNADEATDDEDGSDPDQ